EAAERRAQLAGIVLLPAQLETLSPQPLGAVDVVVHVVRDPARRPQRSRAHVQGEGRVVYGRAFEPLCGRPVLRPVQPAPRECRAETECGLALAVVEEPRKRSAKARQLPVEAFERPRAEVTHPRQPLTRVELFREAEVVVVVATTKRRRIREIAQLLQRELLDRPEHKEAPVLAVPQQALVD